MQRAMALSDASESKASRYWSRRGPVGLLRPQQCDEMTADDAGTQRMSINSWCRSGSYSGGRYLLIKRTEPRDRIRDTTATKVPEPNTRFQCNWSRKKKKQLTGSNNGGSARNLTETYSGDGTM